MKIAIGSDHGGYDLKCFIVGLLEDRDITVEDVGCDNLDSVDYPDFAAAVAGKVASSSVDRGILVCTTGIGVSITANKFAGIRASLCLNKEMAEITRQHNDSNVLCLSQKFTSEEDATGILDAWLTAEFEGGRHGRRVDKIKSYENSAPE